MDAASGGNCLLCRYYHNPSTTRRKPRGTPVGMARKRQTRTRAINNQGRDTLQNQEEN